MSYNLSPAQDLITAFGIDAVCEALAGGTTMTALAQTIGVGIGTFITWCAKPEHSARVREARKHAARVWDEKAERVLLDAEGTKEEIARANALAQHYRWRSSKTDPKEYGDKTVIAGDPDNPVTFAVRRLSEPLPVRQIEGKITDVEVDEPQDVVLGPPNTSEDVT